jgi:hypothetical protein
MAIGKEDTQLIVLMDWIRFNKLDDVTFHCANERSTTPQAGALLKRKGVLAGVSDVIMMKPSQRWHGLAIELKVKGGKTSPAQYKFLAALNREGYCAKVCYSADEAILLIKNYLNLSEQPPAESQTTSIISA